MACAECQMIWQMPSACRAPCHSVPLARQQARRCAMRRCDVYWLLRPQNRDSRMVCSQKHRKCRNNQHARKARYSRLVVIRITRPAHTLYTHFSNAQFLLANAILIIVQYYSVLISRKPPPVSGLRSGGRRRARATSADGRHGQSLCVSVYSHFTRR